MNHSKNISIQTPFGLKSAQTSRKIKLREFLSGRDSVNSEAARSLHSRDNRENLRKIVDSKTTHKRISAKVKRDPSFYRSMLADQQIVVDDDCYDLKRTLRLDSSKVVKQAPKGFNPVQNHSEAERNSTRKNFDHVIGGVTRFNLNYGAQDHKPKKDAPEYFYLKKIDFSNVSKKTPLKGSRQSHSRTVKSSQKDLVGPYLVPSAGKSSQKHTNILALKSCYNRYLTHLLKKKKKSLLGSMESYDRIKQNNRESSTITNLSEKKNNLSKAKQNLGKSKEGESDKSKDVKRLVSPSSSRKRKRIQGQGLKKQRAPNLNFSNRHMASMDNDRYPNFKKRRTSKKRTTRSFEKELHHRLALDKTIGTSQPLQRVPSSKKMSQEECGGAINKIYGEKGTKNKLNLKETAERNFKFDLLEHLNLKRASRGRIQFRAKANSKDTSTRNPATVFSKHSVVNEISSELGQVIHNFCKKKMSRKPTPDLRKRHIKTLSKVDSVKGTKEKNKSTEINNEKRTQSRKARNLKSVKDSKVENRMSDFSYHKNKKAMMLSSSLLMNNEKLEADLTDSNEILGDNMGILNQNIVIEAGAEYKINKIMTDFKLEPSHIKSNWQDVLFVLSQDYLTLSYLNSFDTVLRIIRMIICNFEEYKDMNFSVYKNLVNPINIDSREEKNLDAHGEKGNTDEGRKKGGAKKKKRNRDDVVDIENDLNTGANAVDSLREGVEVDEFDFSSSRYYDENGEFGKRKDDIVRDIEAIYYQYGSNHEEVLMNMNYEKDRIWYRTEDEDALRGVVIAENELFDNEKRVNYVSNEESRILLLSCY